MRTVNIGVLAQLCGTEQFSAFENVCSRRSKKKATKPHEQETLKNLVTLLLRNGTLTLQQLDGFYFSYCIPQISKEFDLLRISQSTILDIELKSSQVPREKIERQLQRNKYYLSHLQRQVELFTYANDGTIYYLNEDNHLVTSSVTELIRLIMATALTESIDNLDLLFHPSKFLISPLNTPEHFLHNDYFLTDQQQEVRIQILSDIAKGKSAYFGITGSAGTGKTLLLYDIAKELCKTHRCLIVHCAPLSIGHNYLSAHMHNCQITIPKDYLSIHSKRSDYDVVLFDEFHRAKEDTFAQAVADAEQQHKQIIFSYDFSQTVSRAEHDRKLIDKLNDIHGMKVFRLSERIRTNKEIADFISKLFQPERYRYLPAHVYPHVTVQYSANRKNTIALIKHLTMQGFTFINHTTSIYSRDTFDSLSPLTDLNSHRVMGQEFDRVLVVINEKFYYENGTLCARAHANPDYLFTQLLYQEVTRTRSELCIIVENNPSVLSQILSLFDIPC